MRGVKVSLSPVPRQPTLRITGLTARPVSWRPTVSVAGSRGAWLRQGAQQRGPRESDFTVGIGSSVCPLSAPCSPCPVGPAAAPRGEQPRFLPVSRSGRDRTVLRENDLGLWLVSR